MGTFATIEKVIGYRMVPGIAKHFSTPGAAGLPAHPTSSGWGRTVKLRHAVSQPGPAVPQPESGSFVYVGDYAYDETETKMTAFTAYMQASNEELEAAEKSPEAALDFVKEKETGLKESFEKAQSMVYADDGTGHLATVLGVSGSVVTVDDASLIAEGVQLDGWSLRTLDAGATKTADGVTVTKVNRFTGAITLSGVGTLAAGHSLVFKGVRTATVSNYPGGLPIIVDNGTKATTYMGKSRADNDYLNSRVYPGPAVGTVQFYPWMLRHAMDDGRQHFDGKDSLDFEPDVLLCHPNQKRAIDDALREDERLVHTVDGTRAVTFTQSTTAGVTFQRSNNSPLEWALSRRHDPRDLYGLCKNSIVLINGGAPKQVGDSWTPVWSNGAMLRVRRTHMEMYFYIAGRRFMPNFVFHNLRAANTFTGFSG